MRSLFLFVVMMMFSVPAFSVPAFSAPLRVVALGDSLTAGYGLKSGEDFATQLQYALVKDGVDVKIDNAGVSGDTTAGGLSRLEWAIQGEKKPDLVIVALGANDMLRGLDPKITRKNLSDILHNLKDKDIPVFLIGMKASLNMGGLYGKGFDRVYSDLAKEYNVPLYPFFLEGVAMDASLNLEDGLHPNTRGIAIMVERIAPQIKKALK